MKRKKNEPNRLKSSKSAILKLFSCTSSKEEDEIHEITPSTSSQQSLTESEDTKDLDRSAKDKVIKSLLYKYLERKQGESAKKSGFVDARDEIKFELRKDIVRLGELGSSTETVYSDFEEILEKAAQQPLQTKVNPLTAQRTESKKQIELIFTQSTQEFEISENNTKSNTALHYMITCEGTPSVTGCLVTETIEKNQDRGDGPIVHLEEIYLHPRNLNERDVSSSTSIKWKMTLSPQDANKTID